MSDTSDKVAENKVRRVAERRGYRLQKSRRRDPLAVDYGGYMLVEPYRNVVVCGASPRAFSATLAEIQSFLDGKSQAGTRRQRRKGRA